jgi:1,5-anhydro-D-fructose reductase (1,5-anhydro-D-mannitol-forming)
VVIAAEVTGGVTKIAAQMIDPNTPATRAAVPCRVAVIGSGLIGRQRARALLDMPGADLAATIDPAGDAMGGAAPHFATISELPGDSYDAAVIAVPHHVAPELAGAVLRAGKPVLMEKPLGTTGSQARELEELAGRVTRPSFVGYNYRFLPAVAQLMRSAQTGELGELRNLDLLVGHGGHPGSADGWKLDPVRAGGGVLLDPGVHLLDLLLRLAPDADCASIEATRGFWRTGIEEDVVATFRAGHLIATVRISHIRWLNTFRIEAYGEDGYALAEGRGGNYGAMTLRRGRRWAWRDPGVSSQRDSEEIRDFGTKDTSLREELAAVVAAWTGHEPAADAPAPAGMTEARCVTELCEQLYPRIGGSGA